MAEPVIRSEQQIGDDAVNALIAQTRKLSDLAPTSILSILARQVFAPELAQLGMSALRVADGSYVQSATGAALDRKVADFGLVRRAASKAWGTVTLKANAAPGSNVTVPAGTEVGYIDGLGTTHTFETRAEAILLAGTTEVDVVVDAVQVGLRGNAGAGAVTTFPAGAPGGIDSVTNRSAFTSGADAESDTGLRARYFDWLDARRRTTTAAVVYGAGIYERTDSDNRVRRPIHSATLEEHLAAAVDGYAATLWVWGQSGEVFDAAQLALIKKHIDGYTDVNGTIFEGWRPVGVPVQVKMAGGLAVSVTVNVTLGAGGSAATLVALKEAIEAYINALGVGQPFRIKGVFDAICTLGTEIANAVITTPATDVFPLVSQKVIAGTVEAV